MPSSAAYGRKGPFADLLSGAGGALEALRTASSRVATSIGVKGSPSANSEQGSVYDPGPSHSKDPPPNCSFVASSSAAWDLVRLKSNLGEGGEGMLTTARFFFDGPAY